jgi:DeoR family transcriptional regulator, glycerol-3-phosphate regulon repressor
MAVRGKTDAKGIRHAAILAELRASPAIRIVELAQSYGVTSETIRRDLDEMSIAGLINRTYGGATVAQLTSEPLLDERYRTNSEQRQILAKVVVPLIRDGDTLMIDSGATTIHVARRLAADCNNLTVVTTSYGVVTALATNPTIRIRICPGEYDPRDGGVVGPDTLQYLSQFHVTHTVIGASRLDVDGPTDFNMDSVSIKKAMIKQADQTILVLDHEKMEKTAFERICTLGAINHLVTDFPIPERLAKALVKARVKVHLPS